MTEAEWLACADAKKMWEFLRGKASERKKTLFGVAWGRFLWERLPHDACRRDIEVKERFVDGMASAQELLEASWEALGGIRETYSLYPADNPPDCALQVAWFRDLFGNPFRPTSVTPAWLAWNDGTVQKLAQSIYDERAFDRLPILADALEEAGCADAALLDHCRGPGPHARGCWAVDLLLGKI